MDGKHKFIRQYDVTNASVHDSQVVGDILDQNNGGQDVYADSASVGEEVWKLLKEEGLRSQINEKGYRNRPLTDEQKASNREKSKIRSRVEHVFGVQSQRAGGLILRGIGLVRAKAKIGLRNLSYNLSRYALLTESG